MKSILEKILAWLARRTIQIHTPVIVGVTGSVGKTSTRDAIAVVLRKKFSVRTPEKNYNNEIGLPLTILGIPHHERDILRWAFSLVGAFFRTLIPRSDYPDVLVLEYGIDRPLDMDTLLGIARPDIAVVTKIGDVPVHVEFFRDAAHVAEEKAKLITSLRDDGIAVLNHDDQLVLRMREKTKSKVVTYGKSLNADVRVMNSEFHTKESTTFANVPDGISFKIQYKGAVTPALLEHGLGAPQVYAAGAAAAVGVLMQMDMNTIVEALHSYEPPKGRLRVIEGIKDSLLLDDTYNAAPESMREALDIFETLRGKRKIAVLGDMLEIGRFSEEAHRDVGKRVSALADILLTVGKEARFIAEEAKATRPKKKKEGTGEKVFSFVNSISAAKMLQTLLRPGDIVLIKGSQGARMERIIEEVMAHPEEAAHILVRQEKHWRGI